jgi:ABC-type multidrug transport system permease subunit
MPRSLRQFFTFFISSFKAQFRTPSSWVWGFLFPVVFIVMFGFVSMNPETSIKIGILKNQEDLTQALIENFSQFDNLYEITTKDSIKELLEDLRSGNLSVVVEVLPENSKNKNLNNLPENTEIKNQPKIIQTYTNSAQIQDVQIFYQALEKLNLELALKKLESAEFEIRQIKQEQSVLNPDTETEKSQPEENDKTLENKIDKDNIEDTELSAENNSKKIEEIEKNIFEIQTQDIASQETRYIDFVLPGILGYSLLSSAVFGVAYSFLSLRKTQVLKRLFAAPTITQSFILGQSMSRFVFIFLQTLLQLLIAHFAFDFNPAAGKLAWFNLIFIMFISLLVFLSFGYVVAGVAKNDDVVAPMANIIVLPQFVLAGTFFAPENLPSWLQTTVRFLPLYNFNTAMRYIAIDGLNIWNISVLIEIGFLVGWGILGYFLASKVFKVKDI